MPAVWHVFLLDPVTNYHCLKTNCSVKYSYPRKINEKFWTSHTKELHNLYGSPTAFSWPTQVSRHGVKMGKRRTEYRTVMEKPLRKCQSKRYRT